MIIYFVSVRFSLTKPREPARAVIEGVIEDVLEDVDALLEEFLQEKVHSVPGGTLSS